MKSKLAKIILSWRTFTLYIIGFFMFIFLFCTPTENCSIAKFFISLVWTKALAAALGYAIYFLWNRWKDTEEIKALEDFCNEGEDE